MTNPPRVLATLTNYREAMRIMKECACEACGGIGERDDADCGDISHSTWICEKCNGEGWNRQEYEKIFSSFVNERDEALNQLDSALHSIAVLERNLRLKHDMLVDCDMKRESAQKQANDLNAVLDRRQIESVEAMHRINTLEEKLRKARHSVLQMVTALGKDKQAEYERGVRTMAANLYHYFGSVSEMERNADHNDEVLGAMAKSLANFDGKLNMNLGQSEEYVEAIYDAANKAAAEGREL